MQHLNTTLVNIQQEKSAVDELMNAKMLENGCKAEPKSPDHKQDQLDKPSTILSDTLSPSPRKSRKTSNSPRSLTKHRERRAHSNPHPSSTTSPYPTNRDSVKPTTPPPTRHRNTETDTTNYEGPQAPPSSENFEASNHRPMESCNDFSEEEDAVTTTSEPIATY